MCTTAVVTARDRTCRGPGRHAPPRLCEVHHLIPWSAGGTTSLQNSGLLCWRCHDCVHTEHIAITHHDGTWTFTDPDGRTTIRGPDQLTA